MISMGKMLIFTGTLLVIMGLIMLGMEKLPWLGRLPGDIHIERRTFSFHFPIMTSLIVSVVLTLLLNLFFRGR
jgi:thiosulfate reductase cytochrome b subunit